MHTCTRTLILFPLPESFIKLRFFRIAQTGMYIGAMNNAGMDNVVNVLIRNT